MCEQMLLKCNAFGEWNSCGGRSVTAYSPIADSRWWVWMCETSPFLLKWSTNCTVTPSCHDANSLFFASLKEMEKSDANNFLILFRDSGCQFRSLYTYCPETEEISKLTGIGPKSISKKMIEGLYKYNSDRKQFSHIPAKTLSASVDAITIHSHLWQSKRPVTPKKLLPAKA